MKKKLFTLFLCIVLVFSYVNIVNSISINSTNENNLVYVDDDNTDGPWDGTIEHPFKEIWRGVNEASAGDRVYVFNGTYTYQDTTIKIDKRINLEGEDKTNTIIDGYNEGNIIEISASNVQIYGFTIRNSGELFSGISVSSSSNHIKNCIFSNNGRGIYIEAYTENNHIYDNVFTNNGILTHSNNEQDIYDNFVNGKPLVYRYGEYSEIISNAGQVILVNCEQITIKRSTIHDVNYGILIKNSNFCDIINNDISNTKYGIYLISSNNNRIIEEENIRPGYNKFYNNQIGVYLSNSNENYIFGNWIYENYENGIYVSASDENVITKNIVIENIGTGICFSQYSEANEIIENYISRNDCYGLYFEINSNNNKIYYNDLTQNQQNAGAKLCINTWDDEEDTGNYWDDYIDKYPDSSDNGYSYNTPYKVSTANKDNYPLLQQYGAPFMPVIRGPNKIKKGKLETFTFIGEDPQDEDDLYYQIDWGDGDITEWIGPYSQETEVERSHSYEELGSYEIKARTKDDYGWGSKWSDPFIIVVSKNKANSKIYFLQNTFIYDLIKNIPIIRLIDNYLSI